MIIVGGGINGVAIARECARAHRRVLLLERNDFASGTTSRSTRIIHGGLRYLQHAEIGLVRESLRERERLLRQHPNLVRPMNFVLALGPDSRHSGLEVRTALWLYRKLAGTRPATSRRSDLWELENQLDAGRNWALFHYEDAQCEFPERLVAEWLIEAIAAGAVVRNHTDVLDFVLHDGKAVGVRCRDLFTDQESIVKGTHLINATGPWADHLCAKASLDTGGPMIGGVRGSHIVLSRFNGAPQSALFMQASDGRPIFVIPWNSQLLVGTTEIPDREDPSGAQPSGTEIDYLLDAVNKAFPNARATEQDIAYAFSGIRPLPFVEGELPSAITRRHILHDHVSEGAAGLISVIGGKLTTAASLARDCARAIGLSVPEPFMPFAAVGQASGMESTLAQWAHFVARTAHINVESAREIAAWHGPRAMCIARLARQRSSLAATLAACTNHIVAEAVDAVRYECAATLGDILLRRVPVALSASWNEFASRQAAERIGEALGWPDQQIQAELERFEMERNSFLREPQRSRCRREKVLPVAIDVAPTGAERIA